MKTVAIKICLIIWALNVHGQSIDKFIRIVGESKLILESKGVMIDINLSEIERNEYNKTQERRIPQIEEELKAELQRLGHNLKDLNEVFPPKISYNRNKQKGYKLRVDSKEKAKAVYELDIAGVKYGKAVFIYDDTQNFNEYELSERAIMDAKKKAERLAQQVGKKVGNVINIEDKTYPDLNLSRDIITETYGVKYRLTITFELLDE